MLDFGRRANKLFKICNRLLPGLEQAIARDGTSTVEGLPMSALGQKRTSCLYSITASAIESTPEGKREAERFGSF